MNGQGAAVGYGYDIGAWADFGVAVAGAAAALTGLVFVAVSINLDRILEYRSLPARTAQTVGLFVTPLFTCVLVLVPGQGATALGVELLALGALAGAVLLRLSRRASPGDEEGRTSLVVVRIAPSAITAVGLAAAGASLLTGTGGALMWIVPAVLAAFAGGLINAWVLLIEIHR